MSARAAALTGRCGAQASFGPRHRPRVTPLSLQWPFLATDVLHSSPIFKCSFDRQKICVLAVFRMLLDSSACPCKTATPRRANGIFRENLRQRIRELTAKCRNVGAGIHVNYL